jgi:hypothetical protein
MRPTRALAFTVLTLTVTIARDSFALTPVADGAQFCAIDQFSGAMFAAATATLELKTGTDTYEAVDEAISEVVVPSGGLFLIEAPWDEGLASAGEYRVQLDMTIYHGATEVLTPTERSEWPANQKTERQATGSPFIVEEDVPEITSTPGTSARPRCATCSSPVRRR